MTDVNHPGNISCFTLRHLSRVVSVHNTQYKVPVKTSETSTEFVPVLNVLLLMLTPQVVLNLLTGYKKTIKNLIHNSEHS